MAGCCLGLGNPFIFDSSGRRVPGTYHHLRGLEEALFCSTLDIKLRYWQAEAIQANRLCGFLVEVGAGVGNGRGSLTGTHVSLGPFQG